MLGKGFIERNDLRYVTLRPRTSATREYGSRRSCCVAIVGVETTTHLLTGREFIAGRCINKHAVCCRVCLRLTYEHMAVAYSILFSFIVTDSLTNCYHIIIFIQLSVALARYYSL